MMLIWFQRPWLQTINGQNWKSPQYYSKKCIVTCDPNILGFNQSLLYNSEHYWLRVNWLQVGLLKLAGPGFWVQSPP